MREIERYCSKGTNFQLYGGINSEDPHHGNYSQQYIISLKVSMRVKFSCSYNHQQEKQQQQMTIR